MPLSFQVILRSLRLLVIEIQTAVESQKDISQFHICFRSNDFHQSNDPWISYDSIPQVNYNVNCIMKTISHFVIWSRSNYFQQLVSLYFGKQSWLFASVCHFHTTDTTHSHSYRTKLPTSSVEFVLSPFLLNDVLLLYKLTVVYVDQILLLCIPCVLKHLKDPDPALHAWSRHCQLSPVIM